jgi:tRNA(adenine34) deaminase
MSVEPVQVFPNKGQGHHAQYMEMALKQATKAFEADEIPIGAVVVENDTIIGRGFNQRETLKDPTAHAEMIAITAAANTRGDWRLNDSVLYVTKEPCPMCAGAIVNSRMKMVVFGCYDEQEGCCGSLYQLCGDPRFKTTVAVKGGILEKKCLGLLQEFFQSKRSLQ